MTCPIWSPSCSPVWARDNRAPWRTNAVENSTKTNAFITAKGCAQLNLTVVLHQHAMNLPLNLVPDGIRCLPSQPVTRLLQKTRIKLRPASSSSRHDRNPSSRISFWFPRGRRTVGFYVSLLFTRPHI